MQPGLARAVPMGIVGFVLGAALVLLLRGLQSMDPVWDAQIGLVVAAFNCAFFFVWGMGAFDPEMNQHHHEPEVDPQTGLIVLDEEAGHHDEADDVALDSAEPRRILSNYVWQIAFWSGALIAVVLLFAALPSGPGRTISADPNANPTEIGYFTTELFGQEVVVSQLVLFLILVAIVVGSLFVIGGGIGGLFTVLSRNVNTAKTSAPQPLNSQLLPATSAASAPALPSGAVAPAARTTSLPLPVYGRALVVPTLLFAALFVPIHITLSLFNISEEPARLVVAVIVTLVVTLLALNVLPKGAGSIQGNQLSIAALIFITGYLVFAVLINAVSAIAEWLYIPDQPSVTVLPFVNAVVLIPYVLSVLPGGIHANDSLGEKVRRVVVPMAVFNVLYLVFYGAAIGLVLPGEPGRTVISIVNAQLFLLVLLHLAGLLWVVAASARWLARVLRGLPAFLGQK